MKTILVFLSFIICTTVLSGCDKILTLAESNLNTSTSATPVSSITIATASNSSTNSARAGSSSSNASSNERNVGSNKTGNNANGEEIVPSQNIQDSKRDIKIAVVYFSENGKKLRL